MPRLAAEILEVVASDIELGEDACVGRRVEEVYARRDLVPHVFEIVLWIIPSAKRKRSGFSAHRLLAKEKSPAAVPGFP
jgi:hypothetical protein